MTTAAIRGLRTAMAGADRIGMISSAKTPKSKFLKSRQISTWALLALAGSLHAVQAQDAVPAEQTPAPVVQPKAPDAAPDGAKLPDVTVETLDKPDTKPAAAKPKAKAVVEVDEPPAPKPAKKVAKKAAKPSKPKSNVPSAPAAPAPQVDEQPEAEAVSSSDAGDTNAESDPLGGPSGIDGYTAKQTTTATKTGTPIKNIPQSISVVTRKQADDQGSKSLGQALTYVPGVNVALGEGHRDAVTIRGQQTTADFFVNGVRDDIEYYRDLYNVDAIEVLKGPSAMTFGRGGGGGVINRATKSADGRTVREATITGGMYDTKRATIDVGQAITSAAAFRLNAMYEDSGNFRDFFALERFAINPTLGFDLTDSTKLLVSYEFYKDDRVVDRGVPSRGGRPTEGRKETFFGNPLVNDSGFEGHTASVTLEHKFSNDLKVRNHASYSDGDKFYSNTFPNSSVSDAGLVAIAGYRDETFRETFINQTDVTWKHRISPDIRHTFLFGTEFGRQETENNRDNARFGAPDGGGSIDVPFANPAFFDPVFFNNPNRRRNTSLDTAGVYVQDQLEVSKYLELIGGIRFDRFDLDFQNGLTGDTFARVDEVWSPRAGLVFKPSQDLSLYVSYSKSFLPSGGDQFNVLNLTTEGAKPEEFDNKEIGFKWDVTPRLAFTGALFRLIRENQVVAAGPFAGLAVGETETKGGELGLTGYITDAWQVSAGFGHQIAEITIGAPALVGKEVPWVPHNTFSLWNRYQFLPWFAAGVGVVHKTDFFAAADNAVQVPGYTRVDAALFFEIDQNWSAQVNVENLFNEDYFASAHNNNNIMPGAPTSVYVTVGAKF